MEKYGFTCEDKYLDNTIHSIDSFKTLYKLHNIDKSKYKMSENEKIISFLNNYFIFKKTKDVDTKLVYNYYFKTSEKMKTIKSSTAKFISREKIII